MTPLPPLGASEPTPAAAPTSTVAAQPTDDLVRVIQVGVDVAGPGEDETVLVARVGGVIIAQHAWSLPDSRGVLSAALNRLRENPRLRVGPVVVDAVGIGYHVATHLADQGYDVLAFNAGGSPLDAEHFVNAKAEAYWALRESLERSAVAGLTDEEMQAQLAGIRYRHTPSGRVEIESKEDAKKRGQQSPDRAEALVLAFARVVPRQQSVLLSQAVTISAI